jgi:orotate phosphoribosyltransferase
LVIDDVVTTGSTLLAAAAALGEDLVPMALAANVVPRASTLLRSEHSDRTLTWPQF